MVCPHKHRARRAPEGLESEAHFLLPADAETRERARMPGEVTIFGDAHTTKARFRASPVKRKNLDQSRRVIHRPGAHSHRVEYSEETGVQADGGAQRE